MKKLGTSLALSLLITAIPKMVLADAEIARGPNPPGKGVKESKRMQCEPEQYHPRTDMIRFRHAEGTGLGYSKGYSSLDFFLTPPYLKSPAVPFVDLRGHLFNDGKPAANFGIGVRWLPQNMSEIFGINFFYDYLKTEHQSSHHGTHKSYRQVGMGLEALGEKWEFRANGYLGVSWKHTHPYDFSFNTNTFKLKAQRQFSMHGADAEAGYNFQCWDWANFYAGLGPYYYHSARRFKETTFGGRGRLSVTLWTYFSLEGITTYDHIFKWRGQGIASINIPFGPRKKDVHGSKVLLDKFFQPVVRNEIIVVHHRRGTI